VREEAIAAREKATAEATAKREAAAQEREAAKVSIIGLRDNPPIGRWMDRGMDHMFRGRLYI